MNRFMLLAVIGLVLGTTSRSRADIAPPLPPAKEGVAIKIEVDEKAKAPRLVLPNGVFTPPRFRPKEPVPGPKGELPQENGDGIGQDDSMQPRNHLLIAGIALTCAMAFGGLWLMRKNGSGSVRGLTLLIAAGATLAAGAIAWANAPPPPNFKRAGPPVAFPSAYEGKGSIEFTYGQEPVRLILDKESYEKLKKGELTAPAAPTKPAPK